MIIVVNLFHLEGFEGSTAENTASLKQHWPCIFRKSLDHQDARQAGVLYHQRSWI